MWGKFPRTPSRARFRNLNATQPPRQDRSLDGENLAEGYLPVLVVTAEPDHKLRALEA